MQISHTKLSYRSLVTRMGLILYPKLNLKVAIPGFGINPMPV
jgi:hypothetical protein